MKLIECPRDAIQGLKPFISTDKKVAYLNYLLSLNLFDVIDFGSFVSPKAMPQMADTSEVIERLDKSTSQTKLLAIIANERGATDAVRYQNVDFLGFPFSVSETFQQRNTNSSIAESLDVVKRINELSLEKNKELVVYLSMAFGNPYGDEWNEEIITKWLKVFSEIGIKTISLSDTIGVANAESIERICKHAVQNFPEMEIGVHLHTTPETSLSKIKAAENSGIKRFDGAMLGYGGCPMAKDDLTGNMPMEDLLSHFNVANEVQIEEMKGKFLELIG
ncbi:MAG: hydroxymethylglutaryl-CoA lyase [Spirosomaceae bacterium]|nr:hydroxymethylglutaryl-CoA lyase [Spirosomataceae bacterium]